MRKSSAALIAVLMLLGAGCSSDAPGPVSCANPVTATTVMLVDYAFDPACTATTPRATLTIIDSGSLPHTFTVTGTSIDVVVAAGERTQVTLDDLAPGIFEVVCTLHAQMRGAIKVG